MKPQVLTWRVLPAALLALSGIAAAQTTQNTTYNYQYDANGNLTQITDPLGHVTNQSYDALNRLTQQLQPAPTAGAARPAINYGYDSQDHLISVTDPRKLTTGYTVDGLGNQTALTSPDTGTSTKTYDAAGNLKTVTDARGKTTSHTYDALNRVTRIAYPGGTATAFEYDGGTAGAPNAAGRLTRITDESGQTSYTYDPLGRVLTKVQTTGTDATAKTYTVSYAYGTSGSATGKPVSLTYPSGNQLNFSYDAAGRINGITLTPNGQGTPVPLLTAIGYTPFGGPNSWTWGNSSATAQNTYARGVDLNGRLTGYPLGNGVTNGLMRTVTYDAASRITGTTHSGTGSGSMAPANFDQSFGYDNLDRLTNFTGSSTSRGYQYDQNGNRTQATFGSSSYANAIAANSNRMTSAAGPLPAKNYSYDAAGNLTGDGNLIYGYSDRGRMMNATLAGSTVSYLYNGLGQRVQKNGPASMVPGGTVQYVYDEQGRLLGEYDASGNALQETVYLGDMPVAVLRQADVYYVYADHLNAPRVITRASDNQIVWRWDNADPFGYSLPDENPGGLGVFTYNLRFPGQYYDRETGLFYNYSRDYDPATGRYIESDPIGLRGGINTYAYVGGNPVSFVDPLGLQRITGVSGPATALVTNSAAEGLWSGFSNAPNRAPDLPGEYVGINYPWALPNLQRVCVAGYYGSAPNMSIPASDNSNGSCKPARPPEKYNASSPGGTGSSNFTCTQWQLVQVP